MNNIEKVFYGLFIVVLVVSSLNLILGGLLVFSIVSFGTFLHFYNSKNSTLEATFGFATLSFVCMFVTKLIDLIF